MFLKKIEMQGFKSFASRTTLEFNSGITAVVGPNGCGKSNISDAIKWMLGETSVKSLRGTKMEDVIFNGAADKKPLGFASVSVIFDNSDKSLPIEYDEVCITRKLYRSGESEYYINKSVCRHKDIVELLYDTGVGQDGYSLISQGEVDRIINSKPEERREIFDEAAGISKYKGKREETIKKISDAKDNIIRINDILAEVSSNLEPLRLQAQKAEKYVSLYERYRKLKIASTMQYLESTEKKIACFEAEYKDNHLKAKNIAGKIDDIKKEMEQNEALNDRSSKAAEESQVSLSNLNKSQAEINGKAALCDERILNIQNGIKEKGDLENKDKDILVKNCIQYKKIKNLIDLKIDFMKKVKLLCEYNDKKIDSINDKIDAYQEAVNTNNDNVIKNLEDISNIKGNIISLKELLDMHKKELESLNNKMSGYKTQIEKDTLNYDKLKEKFDNIDKIYSQYNQLSENESKKAEEMKSAIEKAENELKSIDGEIRNKSIKLLNYNNKKNNERFYSSVDNLLKACENNPDLPKGHLVSRLFTVDDKYSVALDVALGAAGHDIVVENEYEAKKLISYLKEHNMGRVTFMPLSSIRNINEDKTYRLKNEKGFIDYANNIIKYDSYYAKIFKFLLDKTVICDNIDNAIALSKKYPHRFKIATMDGEIFYPSGTLTGGSLNKSKMQKSKLERITYEIKNELINLNKRKRQLKYDIEKLNIDYSNLAESIKNMKNKLNGLAKERTELSNSIYEADINIKNTGKIISELNQDISDRNDSIKNVQEKLDKLKANNNYVKADVDVNLYLSKIDKLKIYLNKCSRRQIRLNIKQAKLNEQINDLKSDLGRLTDDIIEIIKDIDREKNEAVRLNEELSSRLSEKDSLINQLCGIRKDIEQKNAEYQSYTAEKQKLADLISGCKKNAECLEADLKLVQDDIHKIELEKAKLDIKRENLAASLNDYNITYDEARLTDYSFHIEKTEVVKIKKDIDLLKDVNVASIDEYKKANERYVFLNEQKNDLESAVNKLNIMLNEINKSIEDKFIERFDIIRRKFKEIFKIFFGGGNADLILTDKSDILNSGIGIEVQPLGKKLQNMILLSGGEKALCAIALLFAFLNVNPSPFCILDEIDAALDEANVEKFAKYLSKIGKAIQFIIISHRHGTMLAANTVYGITMQHGMSKLISVKIDEEAV